MATKATAAEASKLTSPHRLCRLECTTGGHNKYYEIYLRDGDIFTRHGKIGTWGAAHKVGAGGVAPTHPSEHN